MARSLRRRTQRSEFCGAGSWSGGDGPKRRASEAFRGARSLRRGTPRPALDVHLPVAAESLLARLDALLDDHDPFAIHDDDAGNDAAAPGHRHPPVSLERRVYFFSTASRDAARRAIDGALGADGARATPIDVADDGWAARSHAELRAVQVGDLIVAPPWDAPPPVAGSPTVVIIEPSMGFGTGHHASTRLCLRALQRFRDRLRTGRRMLDLGAGSGVLAIAAVLLGARSATAVDRDPDALANARDNVRRNGVDDRVRLVEGDLESLRLEAGDVVTANLTGAFFLRHAAALLRLVEAGGLLLAGGITVGEEPAVRAALEPRAGVRERAVEEEWVGLVLERPAHGVCPPPET